MKNRNRHRELFAEKNARVGSELYRLRLKVHTFSKDCGGQTLKRSQPHSGLGVGSKNDSVMIIKPAFFGRRFYVSFVLLAESANYQTIL